MTNREVIEDFKQYLNSCKKQLEKIPLDDIGAHIDTENDIKRYEMAIKALEEQDKQKSKVPKLIDRIDTECKEVMVLQDCEPVYTHLIHIIMEEIGCGND